MKPLLEYEFKPFFERRIKNQMICFDWILGVYPVACTLKYSYIVHLVKFLFLESRKIFVGLILEDKNT